MSRHEPRGIRARHVVALLLLCGIAPARPAAAAGTAEYVIQISVDGLDAGEFRALLDDTGRGRLANFERLIAEGASTFNARTDYDHSDTLPNHTSMLTGRPVLKPAGAASNIHHGYIWNIEPGKATIHDRHPDWPAVYVASVFDVAHDNGLSTALYVSKPKFVLFDQSYDARHGAADQIPPDDGADKIDVYVEKSSGFPPNSSTLHADLLANMRARPTSYSFVHYREPDTAGHIHGWGSSAWDESVRRVDGYLGDIFELIATLPALTGKTALVVTSDHGGTGIEHGTASNPSNYTIPFFVWGPGVQAGADLYALNAATRADPGAGRPDYDAARQPIRNGDSGNLALQLLGLAAIPGSSCNANQDLAVAASNAFPSSPKPERPKEAEVGGPDWRDSR